MDFLYLLNHEDRLSTLPRTGWVQHQVSDPETVASHALGVAFLVRTFLPEGLDKAKCLDMAVIHDQAESLVGDITPFDGVAVQEKEKMELRAMRTIAQRLGTPDLVDVFKEYQAQKTPEARFVKDMDRIQAVFKALQYDRTNRSGREVFPEFLANAESRFQTQTGREVLAAFLTQCDAEIKRVHAKHLRQWGGVVLIKGQVFRLAESHHR